MTAIAEAAAVDFPVRWRSPEDMGKVWLQDRLHYPDPITPLEYSLIEDGVDAGLTKSALAYDIPITVHDRHINTYLYAMIETTPLSASESAMLAQHSSAKLEAAMGKLRASWDQVWLPEIQQHLAWWSAFDPASADFPALLHHLVESEQRWQRLWEVHFLLVVPSKLAISEFVDLYADLFGADEPFAPYRMLAGLPTKTLESGRTLWALSRRILADPDVAAVFEECPVEDLIERLKGQESGRLFLALLDGYLLEHGHRADKLSLNYPYWIEDPKPVLDTLRHYLRQPDRDLEREFAETSRQRDLDVAAMDAQLQDYPRAVREEAEARLQAAQEGAFLSEEHGHWIDYKASYCVRRVLLAIGDRLASEKVLVHPADLFYLEMAEVKQLLARPDRRQLYAGEFQPLMARRREHAERFAKVAPPYVLGALVDPPPDRASDGGPAGDRDPIMEMFTKVEGETPAALDPHLIVGLPGSPGVVEGTVKVVHALHEAEKLSPGDILVADTTSPPWTLLFATVGGLVTDSGGILSHSAVVAREYGIPAVVGAGDATKRLEDGQRVEVDGRRGTVRVLA